MLAFSIALRLLAARALPTLAARRRAGGGEGGEGGAAAKCGH